MVCIKIICRKFTKIFQPPYIFHLYEKQKACKFIYKIVKESHEKKTFKLYIIIKFSSKNVIFKKDENFHF